MIDEADLILSYGHSADVQRLLDPTQGHIPAIGVQGILMSATMTNDVQALKGLVLRSPVRSIATQSVFAAIYRLSLVKFFPQFRPS